jgi:hypothetical protein
MLREKFIHRQPEIHRLTHWFATLVFGNKRSIYIGLNCLVILSLLAAQFVSISSSAAAAAPDRQALPRRRQLPVRLHHAWGELRLRRRPHFPLPSSLPFF